MLAPGIARHQVEFAALEKIKLKLWLKAQWCIPPKQSGGVWRMEDALDVCCLGASPPPTPASSFKRLYPPELT
jgi:hypothetical protein